MDLETQFMNGLLVLAVFIALVAFFVWSRRRGRETRQYSQRRMREHREIVLYSSGEGLAASVGLLFLFYTPMAFGADVWKGVFASIVGVGGLLIWARYAFCVRKNPCLVLNDKGVGSPLYGQIPWSNIEDVSRVKFTVKLVEIDYLVLKLRDIERARHDFVAPFRWLYKYSRGRDLKFKLANMSLPGDDVFSYAKSAVA